MALYGHQTDRQALASAVPQREKALAKNTVLAIVGGSAEL
jgi:hypothetical protein